MADLLTHVLLTYAVLTTASWVHVPLTKRWIVVGTAGAAIPDLMKIGLIVPSQSVSAALGVPFSWRAIGTVTGVFLIAGVIALLFPSARRRRAYVLLSTGGTLSLLIDGLRSVADGHMGRWLPPVQWYPPTPNIYVTSDPAFLSFGLAVAGITYAIDRRLR